jgi:PleD family two-component response regulator
MFSKTVHSTAFPPWSEFPNLPFVRLSVKLKLEQLTDLLKVSGHQKPPKTDAKANVNKRPVDRPPFSISEYCWLESMSKRILSVSYDSVLLATREMLLKQKGYQVTSAFGFTESMEHCRNGRFHLFILGHSIPHKDKLQLINAFRSNCPAPILSLQRFGETDVPSHFYASPDDPEKFLKVVDEILAAQETRLSSA